MNLSSSILFTLLYGDIFGYPYTLDELAGWMPKRSWPRKAVTGALARLIRRKKVVRKGSFFSLYGHGKHVATRLRREQCAVQKKEKALRAARILRWVPTVTLVGITGGLSISNSDEEDDIDFFICAKKGTLWTTRFFSTVLTELFSDRRRPGSVEVKDAVCLNMFVSEEALAVSREDRDIFSAHEVLQMQPLWERGGAYAEFLKKNTWVSSLFPRKWKETVETSRVKTGGMKRNCQLPFIETIMKLLEKPLEHIQILYMRQRRTHEIVTDRVIRFHPHDARLWILPAFRSKLKRYNLPLDKKFFQP